MTDHTDLITRLRKGYEHGDSNNCLEAADALEAAQAEIEKLRKDAARYDWFADIAVSGDFERAEKAFNCFEFAESCTRQEIDAAIDAAIRKELTP